MKKMMRFLIVMCIYVLAFSTNSFAAFSDVEGDYWCENQINDFLESGFIDGYEDGTFRPEQAITRAEFSKIINSYMGYEVSGEWQEANMQVAKEKGYLTVGEKESTITREEAFVSLNILMNLADVEGVSLDYLDSEDISIWALQATKNLTFVEYIKGFPDSEIKPKQDMTRAELVAILYEYVGIGGLDEEIENVEFSIGQLVHNEYGIEFVEIIETLEIESGDSITLAATVAEEDGDVKFEVLTGKELVDFDEESLVLEALVSGNVEIRARTTDTRKEKNLVIKIK